MITIFWTRSTGYGQWTQERLSSSNQKLWAGLVGKLNWTLRLPEHSEKDWNMSHLPVPGRNEMAVPWLGNNSQGSGGPPKDSRVTPSCDLTTVEQGACARPQPLTVPKTQRTEMFVGPRKIEVGMNLERLQRLMHTEVEMVWPRRFTEKGILQSCSSGMEMQSWSLLLWPSEEAQKVTRDQKSHRWPTHIEPISLTRVGETLHRQRHLRSETAGHFPRR